MLQQPDGQGGILSLMPAALPPSCKITSVDVKATDTPSAITEMDAVVKCKSVKASLVNETVNFKQILEISGSGHYDLSVYRKYN